MPNQETAIERDARCLIKDETLLLRLKDANADIGAIAAELKEKEGYSDTIEQNLHLLLSITDMLRRLPDLCENYYAYAQELLVINNQFESSHRSADSLLPNYIASLIFLSRTEPELTAKLTRDIYSFANLSVVEDGIIILKDSVISANYIATCICIGLHNTAPCDIFCTENIFWHEWFFGYGCIIYRLPELKIEY